MSNESDLSSINRTPSLPPPLDYVDSQHDYSFLLATEKNIRLKSLSELNSSTHQQDDKSRYYSNSSSSSFPAPVPSSHLNSIHPNLIPSSSFTNVFSFITSSSLYSSPSVSSISNANETIAASSSSAAFVPIPPQTNTAHSHSISSLPSRPIRNSEFAVIVSNRQRGNPLLSHIRNCGWEYEIVSNSLLCDYMLSPTTCALYLSLKYHMLHPQYLHTRMTPLKPYYTLKVLLLHIDIETIDQNLVDLTKICFVNGWTLIVAWSLEECGRYLEIMKVMEKKGSEGIQERVDESDSKSKLSDLLTLIRSINRTDVTTLATTYRTFSALTHASTLELAQLPGLGKKKCKRLWRALHQPFVSSVGIVSQTIQAAQANQQQQLQTIAASNAEKKSPSEQNSSSDEPVTGPAVPPTDVDHLGAVPSSSPLQKKRKNVPAFARVISVDDSDDDFV